jgi:CRISPR/Cas system CSM-associated protein Csm3 (group 7 of RAMP superfamily)
MKNITYKITFYSEWHCGSGLTSGSDLDALVVKDAEGFPFIPGKTIKGLLQEAAMELFGEGFEKEYLKLQPGRSDENSLEHFIPEVFGYFDEKKISESRLHVKGSAFFSNASLSSELRKNAEESKLIEFFFRDMASTAIGDNGIAKEHSLRRMETVIPCELVASIIGVDEKYMDNLKKCLKYIKRLGQNRNRGLGRCKFEVIEPKEEAEV